MDRGARGKTRDDSSPSFLRRRNTKEGYGVFEGIQTLNE